MFERIFSSAMGYGSRLLFGASIVMLLVGVASFTSVLMSDVSYFATIEHIFYNYMHPAAYLLFGAVLIDRLRRD